MTWISVEERLPPPPYDPHNYGLKDRYLVAHRDRKGRLKVSPCYWGRITAGSYPTYHSVWQSIGFTRPSITHWQPFPKHPFAEDPP